MKNMKNYNLNESGLNSLGAGIIRYGLAIVLIWIGITKFMPYEADGIKPLVMHSPLLSWTLGVMSIYTLSMFIGAIEIIIGLLIAIKNFAPQASAIGSFGAMITFFITLTFLLSTPGIIQMGQAFPFLSPMPGEFLVKDIVLFGGSAWTAGEALTIVRLTNPI